MAAALLVAWYGGPASAQDEASPSQLLEDFVHYALVARPDLATASGQRLLESVSDAELAELVDEGPVDPERVDNAMLRLLRVPEGESIAGEFALRTERGRQDLAREGDRIDQAIQMLVGTQRQRLLAKKRLEAAGEYAVPALLYQVTDGNDDTLKLECENMIRTIGLPAVTPLCAALMNVDPQSQKRICEMLGAIGYPHAAPYLAELAMNQRTPAPVRSAAERAVGSVRASIGDLSEMYADLGREYFRGATSLIAHPFEPTNNVWSYDSFVGLVATPVPTEIFTEIMTMKMAGKALESSDRNAAAMALFVASNLKRENDLPDGATDPIYGNASYSPEFFATVFGTAICQDVLGMALDRNDTPLVRDAIAALNQTTGGANLFTAGARQPLLEAISYPDRRVQYEAALTLARSLPEQKFEGDYRVVPLLASAVRTGSESYAIVLADDEENARNLVGSLESMNFTVLGSEADVASLADVINEAPGIDLVVVRMGNADDAKNVVSSVRREAKTAAAPIAVFASGVDVGTLRQEYIGQSAVLVGRPPIGADAMEARVDALLDRAAGGRLTEAAAEGYAFEALGALETVAISCSPAFSVGDAEFSLLDALGKRDGRAKLLIADILAYIDSNAAQQALMDVALDASGGERIDLLDRVAKSIKRHGNKCEAYQVSALVELVEESTGSTADAAARVHGALNIPATGAVGMIQKVLEGDDAP